MTIDLAHNVVAGFEHGFQDIVARPDAARWCAFPGDRGRVVPRRSRGERDRRAHAVDPRGTAAPRGRRARRARPRGRSSARARVLPVRAGPSARRSGYRRHVEHPSHVYTVGEVADPKGLAVRDAHGEHGPRPGGPRRRPGVRHAQSEINLRHSPALDAADRAFRYRTAVKDLAARHGLLATFMGKPWNDDEGSGSAPARLLEPGRDDAFADPSSPDGLELIARRSWPACSTMRRRSWRSSTRRSTATSA